MQTIVLNSEFIKLDQALKKAGLVGTGGEAKQLILAGEVEVNGEKELRRGRKLYGGDRFTLQEQQVEVQAPST